MTLFAALPFAAALCSLLLAVASLLRKKPSVATWCFFAGMSVLGLGSLLTGLALRATHPEEADRWLTLAFMVRSFVPAIWLAFSLTYSRGNSLGFLRRWRLPLLALAMVPTGLALGFHDGLLQVLPPETPAATWWLHSGPMGKVVDVILVAALALVLTNLEQTFRAAVGTMRWRIKYVILGLAVIFGAQVYVGSQAILFSTHDMALSGIASSGLLIGCLFLALAYARTGLAEIDVYPSLAVLRSSLTVFILGGYLFIVGILAEIARYLGGVESFQFQAFVVLLGMAGLAVLLLSDRLRQRVHGFAVRHFTRAQHDAVRVWTSFSQRLANVRDEAGLCSVSARLISEIFDVLSVTIWLLDDGAERLVVGASSARQSSGATASTTSDSASAAVASALRARPSPFDLEEAPEAWADELRQLNPSQFPQKGGNRWCVPLWAGERNLGAIVLADRVNGAVYTAEELELLRCIADQVTSVLLNLRLGNEVARAREMEAFRTMSAFFVHDLKNAATSLNLMLKNLPVHFEDPAFREDALRSVGNTARRIDDLIDRLSALRQQPAFEPVEADLNTLVNDALDRLNGMLPVELSRELHPLPRIRADGEQIQGVVTNLVLNARDAVGLGGRIEVRTDHRGNRVVLSVADNGCGMSRTFLKESLFRPFHSTKKQGLGIGMFQSRLIVERHGGSIQVESEPGHGTTVRVSLPATDAR